MRFVRNLIPLSVILTLGVGVACKKPAPAPVEPPKPVQTGPTQAELEAQAKVAAEEARRKAAAAAEAEAARKAAAASEAAAKAASNYRAAAEAALKDINFDFDKSDIREADKAKLQAVADFMKAFPQAKLSLEGHCDERGTVEYNLALGERRAHAAQAYLVGLGVEEARLSSISFGKEKPKVQGHDDQSWLINRRCEFKLQ
jgi:peptidoglycan-associated lipoprotein